MALLSEEDEEKKQAQQNQIVQPVQPTQPAPAVPSAIKPAMAPAAPKVLEAKQPQRQGTGFTNLNRIMQANQGNNLGQNVAGGITNRVQNLQSGVQQSQQAFGQQSQAARLDTPEAVAQRQAVLGRFDTANFNPDESKFAVSSGLQSNYQTQKDTLSAQQASQKEAAAKQQASIQARYDADTQALAAANAASQSGDPMSRAMAMNKAKTLKASLSSLKGLLGAYSGSTQALDAETASKLANIESQYGTMSAAEKDNWIKGEKERMVSEQLPTESEAEAFRRFQTGTYTGPQELQDYQSLLGKAQQTEDLGTLSRSSGGRQELLKQFVGGRDYTQGQRGLDEAILAQDGSSALSRAAKKALGSEKTVQQTNKLAGAQAQDLIGKARLFGEETRTKIGEARAPISGEIDADVAAAQKKETDRQSVLKNYQDILAGTDPKYAGMDQLSRTGLALQDAANSGFLNQSDLDSLLGNENKYGLLERGMKQGIDINKLLSSGLSSTSAQNINRSGVASEADRTRLNALDRLMGKTASESEFGSADRYKAGGIGLNQSELQKQIEAAEGVKDPSYNYKPYKFTPTEQMLMGSSQNMKDWSDSGEMTDALTGLSGDLWNKNDHTARIAEGTVQKASGAVGAGIDTEDAVLKKILSSGLMGRYGDKYGGKQLNQLVDYQTKLKEEALGSLTKEGMNMAGGLRDLTQTGRLDQAIAKLSGFDAAKNITGNVTRELSKGVSTALNGGKTGNWGTNEFNTIDASSGKKVKIGTYANKSSSDILKQMLSSGQMARTASHGNSGNEGAKAMNELLKYYQAALKREGKKK